MRLGPLFLVLVLAAGAAGPASAATPRILPHRAVYDIGLLRSEAGSGVAAAEGRMVFEVTGGACEGYSMRQRMVVRISDESGNLGLLDFRITTFESADGNSYSFDSTTTLNREIIEAIEGEARRLDGLIEVRLNEPAVKTVRIDGSALFPSQHMQALLDAALAERSFLAVDVYEGAGTGEASDAAAAAIGAVRHGNPPSILLRDTRHWPISVGYFDGGEQQAAGAGEELPSYQLSYKLYENGVTNDLVMDFGDYALTGSLEELEALAGGECLPQ
jgi:hypothetical protein